MRTRKPSRSSSFSSLGPTQNRLKFQWQLPSRSGENQPDKKADLPPSYVIIKISLRIIPGEGPNCSSSVTMSFLVPGYLQVQLLVDTITFRYNDMWVELHGILIWFCNILFGHEHKYNDITTITWMLRIWFYGQKGLDRKQILFIWSPFPNLHQLFNSIKTNIT